MNSAVRHYLQLWSVAIAAVALGVGIGKIIIAVADLKPRCSPDCSLIAPQDHRPARQEVTPQ